VSGWSDVPRGFYCPLDDGDDFPGSTNCGGADFCTGLRRDLRYAQAHLGADSPMPLRLSDGPGAFAGVLRPFTCSAARGFYGAPSVPGGSDWELLGAAAGYGQGFLQASTSSGRRSSVRPGTLADPEAA
jgi:hypothetical protein